MIKEAQLKLDVALNFLQQSNLSNCSTPLPTALADNKKTLLAIASNTTTLQTNRRHSLSVLPVDPVKSNNIRKSLSKMKSKYLIIKI